MKYLIIIATTITFSTDSISQTLQNSLVSSGGDTFKNSNAQIEWTLGELATETYTNGVYLTQGFLQGSPVRLVGINEANVFPNQFSATIYPSPFLNSFRIRLQENIQDILSVKIYDQLGQSLLTVENIATDEEINLSGKAAGIYLVLIYTGTTLVETIKVRKL